MRLSRTISTVLVSTAFLSAGAASGRAKTHIHKGHPGHFQVLPRHCGSYCTVNRQVIFPKFTYGKTLPQ